MTWQSTASLRAAIGLGQGFALYFLYVLFQAKVWPATAPTLFAGLLAAAIFAPLIAVQSYGNLRPRSFAIWTAAAAVLCAGLAGYDIYRGPIQAGGDPRLIPAPTLWIALAGGLFILHSLIVAGAADGRFTAGYPRYFDSSWKHAVQLVLALLFVGVLWALLLLGGALFMLIKLDFFMALIWQPWFWMPVSALATACALHVTDASAGLVRGTRTLKLTLLSWLLPMMTAIAVAFLLALPVTGLEPLWSTRRAATILLTAAAALVLLINAAYQDGQSDTPVPSVLRYSRLAAAVILVPLVGLAGYALSLRIQQYGWTPRRITALSCFVVLACYAVGYVAAAALSGTAMRQLQITNIATAYVILAVLAAIFSPIADPTRISVADQMRRLDSGRTPPDKFDYKFLRFGAGRYGRAALHELAARETGSGAQVVAQHAKDALALKNAYQNVQPPRPPSTAESRGANITVVQPAGQSLPADFLTQDWTNPEKPYPVPHCLMTSLATAKCEAVLADLDGDGTPEVLLFNLPTGAGVVFKRDAARWVMLGQLQNSFCRGVREALRAGEFNVTAPRFQEVEAAGNRLRMDGGCAPTPSAARPSR